MNVKQNKCYNAITKAYSSLREKKLPNDWAANVGVTIYKFHDPKASKDVAKEKATSLLGKLADNQCKIDCQQQINPNYSIL
jgi:hypothetical protein